MGRTYTIEGEGATKRFLRILVVNHDTQTCEVEGSDEEFTDHVETREVGTRPDDYDAVGKDVALRLKALSFPARYSSGAHKWGDEFKREPSPHLKQTMHDEEQRLKRLALARAVRPKWIASRQVQRRLRRKGW